MVEDHMASREPSHTASGTRADGGATFWTPSDLEAPPKDVPFWAWLHETGVHRMEWVPNFYDDEDEGPDNGAYAISAEKDEDYNPKFWAPITAIPNPADEWAHAKITGEVWP